MKTQLTFIFLLIIIGLPAKSQTQKGSQLLGGNFLFGITNANAANVNFNNSGYNFSYKSKEVSFLVGPVYSYFIADKLDLGLSLGYGTDKTTYNYSVANTNYSILPYKNIYQRYNSGIYLRKYFLYNQKIGIRTGPFAEYQKYKLNYLFLEPQTNNNNFSQNGYAINAGVILDLVYFPSKKIGLISNLGNLGYSNSNSKFQSSNNEENDRVNSFGLRLISALNLSVVYCLGK